MAYKNYTSPLSRLSSGFSNSINNSTNSSFLTSTPRSKHKIHKFGLCPTCERPNTHDKWCRSCNAERFRQKFEHWTSGSKLIDDFIKDAQLSATNHRQILEWIPYDQFQNFNYVAKGGFAEVYSAVWKDGFITKWNYKENNWERMNRWKVALKILHNSAKLPSEFFDEVRACVQCGGGFGLIRCYGISQDPVTGNFIIVLYYAHRGNLRNYLEQHYEKLDWTQKLVILKQIAEGLKKIHQAGFVHKDFHSGNILQGTTAEISDLGFTGPADKRIKSSPNRAVYGVLPYVSPEVLRGKKYSFAADVYSFGIIMWEVSECLPPFSDRAHDCFLALDICRGLRPTNESYIPKPFSMLMNKCWDADPLKRPSAHELYQILHKWYWDLRDGNENEITAAFNTADYHSSRLSTPASSRPVTQTHPLAVYTSRLLVFSGLPEPINAPSRTESIDIVTDSIECLTRQFRDELSLNLEKCRIESETTVSEVTFVPEDVYITRQYDTELPWEGS